MLCIGGMIARCVEPTKVATRAIKLSDEPPTRGSLAKIFGDVLVLTTMEQLAESLVSFGKAGLGVENMQKVLGTIFPGDPLKVHSMYANRLMEIRGLRSPGLYQ